MADRPAVLVPVQVLEGETIPEGIPDLLANAHVVLLGYHEIPEQTAANQARMQFEEKAEARLEDFSAMLEAGGATVEAHLVFTHEGQTTIDRTIRERECLAVLVPNATGAPEDVLVAVRGEVGLDRIARLVGGLFAGTGVSLTLFHVVAEEAEHAEADDLLERLTAMLVGQGVDGAAIETEVASGGRVVDHLEAVTGEYDAIVMGESDPSLVTFVFGLRTEQVAERFLCPVLVVQHEPEEPDP